MELYLIRSGGFDPYFNLALEEYLLSYAKPGSAILYLWQNDNTVVIGRNQNPWVECRTELLQAEGGKLARRQSGGGAVYHDLGNLNFTFLCHESEYLLDKNLAVIEKACQYAGLSPAFSGRNDLLVEGKKFSGNAFHHTKGFVYHHGTLLIRSNIDKLQRYLSPPKAKLEAKGISSVRSRVVNLSQLAPTLDCNTMQENMIRAFGAVFGGMPSELTLSEEALAAVSRLAQTYASRDWLFGKPFPFTCTMESRFSFGSLQLQLSVENGTIRDLLVYTDAMDPTLPHRLSQALRACPFTAQAMGDSCADLTENAELRAFFCQQLP